MSPITAHQLQALTGPDPTVLRPQRQLRHQRLLEGRLPLAARLPVAVPLPALRLPGNGSGHDWARRAGVAQPAGGSHQEQGIHDRIGTRLVAALASLLKVQTHRLTRYRLNNRKVLAAPSAPVRNWLQAQGIRQGQVHPVSPERQAAAHGRPDRSHWRVQRPDSLWAKLSGRCHCESFILPPHLVAMAVS